jgi:F420-non-reducing hydrogenase large subunit
MELHEIPVLKKHWMARTPRWKKQWDLSRRPLRTIKRRGRDGNPPSRKRIQTHVRHSRGKINSTLAFHWARLIELLYATERAKELIEDPEITSTHIRDPVKTPGAGIGVVEAARGTLIHDYKLDKNGLVEKANLIVATTNNAGAITMSVRDAAKGVIHKGNVNDGLLNKVEMAFRAYDPCFACATHTLPGGMPLIINIYDHNKNLTKTISQS